MTGFSPILTRVLAVFLFTFPAASFAQIPGVPVKAPDAAPAAVQAPAPAPQQPAPVVDKAEITKRANDDMGQDIAATIKTWRAELESVDKALKPEAKPKYAELNVQRERLERIRGAGRNLLDRLRPKLEAMKGQLQRLGSPPAAGQAPEPEQDSQFRAEVAYHTGVFSGAEKDINDVLARTESLINAVQDQRRRNFTTNLFSPVPGIYLRSTWENAPENAATTFERVRAVVYSWWSGLDDRSEVIRTSVQAGLLWLVLAVLALFGSARLRAWKSSGEPPFWRRASSAAGVILLKSLATVLPVLYFYHSIIGENEVPDIVGWLMFVCGRTIIIVFVVQALVTTVFTPGAPHWRLIPATNGAAQRICILVVSLATVYGLSTVLYAANQLVKAPFSLSIVESLPLSLIEALLVVGILRTPLGWKSSEGLPSIGWLRLLRIPVWLIAIFIVISALSGYLALSRFAAQQLVVTGSILAVVYLMLLWVEGFTQGMSDDSALVGGWLRSVGLEVRRREQLAVPTGLILKFAVLVLSVPLIMLQWGYAWSDIIYWYRQLFFDLKVGNTEVSLAVLAASVLVFVLGYVGSRIFQGWLDQQILKPAGLSGGLRDSIRTGVGYIGVTAAAIAAFSYAGFNLSNLAIVAGALSVGIGFGLQSVVSNFVSGLILLAERPIKVGDLVVVGGEEGYVRKISVRSTEIETFDRANVLIPNSYFITEKVKNWTLRNNTGRVAIAVGVSYGCDPRKVKAALLKAANDHLNVMTSPAPFVDFEAFGADTLDFQLYAYIHDLNKSIATRTDLRIAILDEFAKDGIVIPSRQTDVTLRDMDWLRDAVSSFTGADNHEATNGAAAKRR